MNELSLAATIGDIVAHDVRAGAVFARHDIDFCCGGRRSVEDVCRERGVDPNDVLREIAEATRRGDAAHDATTWPVDTLLDHIVNTHHAYVRRQIPLITLYLERLTAAHGTHHPGLTRVAAVFGGLAGELMRHMEKEEEILFPFIRAMVHARSDGARIPPTPFGTVRNPVRMMEHEHQQAGADLWLLRVITNGFEPPPDACVTWRACYGELADFERDLHEHVHLENSVLFPAAARLEEELLEQRAGENR